MNKKKVCNTIENTKKLTFYELTFESLSVVNLRNYPKKKFYRKLVILIISVVPALK